MVGCPNTHTRTTPEKTYTKNLNNTPLKVIHQNIRGLRKKSSELLTSILPDIPQIICIAPPLVCVVVTLANLIYATQIGRKRGAAQQYTKREQ
jgi:hypothetical protein